MNTTSEGSTSDRTPADQRNLDLIAVLIMSITAVLTAWTGFQSAKWGGEMSLNLSQAASRRTNSLLISDLQGTLIGYQNDLAIAWTDAESVGDVELAALYRSLFPEGLEAAFAEWEAMPVESRPASPLALDSYGDGALQPAIELLNEADHLYQSALTSNQRSDNYVITTVLSASVLFFAALATKLSRRRLQIAMLILAAIGLVVTVAFVATFPVKI